MSARILHGDCLEVLSTMEADSVDAVVTDPPYHLASIVKRFGKEGSAPAKSNGPTGVYARASAGFMGKTWDGGDIAMRPETWAEVLRVLKPGGHLVAFGGTRTYHRMACAIEDAGFEIRDSLSWIYGTGFPKSLDVAKAIDKAAGAERTEVIGVRPGHEGFEHRADAHSAGARREGWDRPWKADPAKVAAHHLQTAPATDAAKQWQGWGTALKPSFEPIILARKPLACPTVAAQVLATGTGALNIDGCRVGTDEDCRRTTNGHDGGDGWGMGASVTGGATGRWPSNLLHDNSPEVLAAFARFGASKSTGGQASLGAFRNGDVYGKGKDIREKRDPGYGDHGSAARFFPALGFEPDELRFHYSAKASRAERGEGNGHPTVKPQSLMRWLSRLCCPPGGTILDPFLGSGSTALAAMAEGFHCIGIEREEEYVTIARARIAAAQAAATAAKRATPQHDLFAELVA